MANQDTGSWGSLKDWPLIGIHAIVTQDGKVLSFGTDSRGMQGGSFIYDVWDPVTDTHTTLDNKTATDIFCSAAIILPGTSKIVIGGGDGRPQGAPNTGVDDVNFFDNDDLSLTQSTLGEMNFNRWYPTMVNLPSGQTIIMGGRGGKSEPGVATPEIFTEGEGWRKLDGATDLDLAQSNAYPRAFVNGDGNITYFASDKGTTGKIEVRVLDPSGNGSVETIGILPFTQAWQVPAIMYEAGKVLITATNGDVWTMDITGSEPVFEQTESLTQLRNSSNLTVLADGRVLVNGGSDNGNKEDGADKTAAIWDPETGEWEYMVDEDNPRLYHSTSVLLADGTLLSMGGGAAGFAENNYLDAQIYKPPYLYDDNGNLADRPTLTGAPEELVPGDAFTVHSENTISKMTLVKNGATTHSFNMEARMVHLEFTQNADGSIEVTLPDNVNEVTAGSWMLFAFDENGVPAQAPIISVQPTLANFDGIGDVTAEYFAIDAATNSLDQIDFDGEVIHTERVLEINENSANAYYEGGPASDFAIKYSGEFFVSQPGSYTFYMTSDDGSRLFVDGEKVIEHDGAFAAKQKTVTLELDAGNHDLEMRYFEARGDGRTDLDWSGPGFTRTQMRFDGAEDNLLVNGGFEKAGNPDTRYGSYTEIPGWTSSTGRFELLADGYTGSNVASGYSHAEIEPNNGTVSQTVNTVNGQEYDLTFSYAARMEIYNRPMDVLWNGELVETITPQSTVHEIYALKVEGTGSDVLQFRPHSGGNAGLGGVLDSVVLAEAEGSGPVDPGQPEPTNTINGTQGNDYLNGTDANDLINLYNGRDVVNGSGGNDTIVGTNKNYDQVDYSGKSSDYTFTANSDGTLTAVKPGGTKDLLKSIDGFWFSGDGVWKSYDDILKEIGAPTPDQTITGTAGSDYLSGGSGDDKIDALAGEDVISGSGGNDTINGGGKEYDQVDYDGRVADYTFTTNSNGSISVAKPDGSKDLLSNIDGIWFAGDEVWKPMDELATGNKDIVNIVNGTNGADYLSGTSGSDEINAKGGSDVLFGSKGDDKLDGGGSEYDQINYEGSRSDYVFSKNADGTIKSVSTLSDTDLLSDIDGIWFEGEGEWYALDDLA